MGTSVTARLINGRVQENRLATLISAAEPTSISKIVGYFCLHFRGLAVGNATCSVKVSAKDIPSFAAIRDFYPASFRI